MLEVLEVHQGTKQDPKRGQTIHLLRHVHGGASDGFSCPSSVPVLCSRDTCEAGKELFEEHCTMPLGSVVLGAMNRAQGLGLGTTEQCSFQGKASGVEFCSRMHAQHP